MSNRYLAAQDDLGREKAEQMMANDAMSISGGACNPIAIAGILHEQLVFRSRNPMAGVLTHSDPAIRLVMSQLAFLVFGDDGNPKFYQDYQAIGDRLVTC